MPTDSFEQGSRSPSSAVAATRQTQDPGPSRLKVDAADFKPRRGTGQPGRDVAEKTQPQETKDCGKN